jgi:signal peptidase I
VLVDLMEAREPVTPTAGSATPELIESGKQAERSKEPKKPPGKDGGGLVQLLREGIELVVVTLVLLIVIRWAIAEARYIPSSSMEPTLQINDRLLVEKWSGHLGKPIKRGDILVFYPPPLEMGGKDLSNDPLTVLGRLTGLPFLPNEPAFIKRCIGLPGDHIKVQKGVGVFINGELLDESLYTKERPNYDLNVLADIGGRASTGFGIRPYEDVKDPIVVPAGHLFMMGDNRNNSEDSHVWGFLDQKRVIGRACLLFWRRLEAPLYPRFLDENN